MKNINNKQFRSLLDTESELDVFVEKKNHEIISTTVMHEAKTLAYKNLPEPLESSFEGYITTIKGAYTSLLQQVAIKLKGGMQKELGSVNLATSNQKISIVENSIKKEEEKRRLLENDMDRIQPNYSYKAYKSQQIVHTLFAAAECLNFTGGFSLFGDISLVALIIGVALGVAQVTVSVRSIQIIREIRNSGTRKIYYSLLFLGFAAVSLLFGMLRYYIAHSGTASDIPFLMLNPLTFAAFNMLLVLATCLTVYFYYPSRAEMKKLHELEDAKNEVRKVNRYINHLSNERLYLINDRELFMELHTQALHAHKELNRKVCSCYDEAIGRFKHENVIKRTDGQYPESFKQKHEPLSTPDLDQTLINHNSNK